MSPTTLFGTIYEFYCTIQLTFTFMAFESSRGVPLY